MNESLPDLQRPIWAVIAGKPVTEVPADLFIPPDALEILLDSFTGPLDLLLYLIRRQNIDILDIPIAHITRQYMQYIQLMEEHRLELAADYLVMAAMLAEIKSRMLLPPMPTNADEIEEDPRLTLVKKLQAYEQFKQASLLIDVLSRSERDTIRFSLNNSGVELEAAINPPDVVLSVLVDTMHDLVKRQGHSIHHHISREPLSVRERMGQVLERLQLVETLPFTDLLRPIEGRMGLAVTFIAVLELSRQSLLMITQTLLFSPIHLKAIAHG
jgi:segregation and condensation protein A